MSNLNARAANGENYQVLYGVATPQGVNPATLAQGQKTTGKVYFDVTGAAPITVVYNAGGVGMLVWAGSPTPAPSQGGTRGPSSLGGVSTAITPEIASALPEGAPTEGTPTEVLPGSVGTPIPATGSQGAPVPAASANTPAVAPPAAAGMEGGTPVVTPATPATPAPAPAR